MWRNQRSTFKDNVKYNKNETAKNFREGLLQYAKRVHDMHNLAKYPPPPSTKGSE